MVAVTAAVQAGAALARCRRVGHRHAQALLQHGASALQGRPHVYVSFRGDAGKTTVYYVPRQAQQRVRDGIEAWRMWLRERTLARVATRHRRVESGTPQAWKRTGTAETKGARMKL